MAFDLDVALSESKCEDSRDVLPSSVPPNTFLGMNI